MAGAADPERHHRRSIRLKAYDYTWAGAYFVTICTASRECLFGEIGQAGVMQLNACGLMVTTCWNALPDHLPSVELDEYVIMPNHVHGIVVIAGGDMGNAALARGPGAHPGCRGEACLAPTDHPTGAKPGSLGAIVGSFKSASTRRINALRGTPGASVWQRNYYERVIRDDQELDRVRQYIVDNPVHWAEDENHPSNTLKRRP